MKTSIFKIIVITLAIGLVSCKKEKETVLTEYKYGYKPNTITCGDLDTDLLKEALYSFENDISIYYDADRNTLVRSYSRLIKESINGSLKYENMVSKHTVAIFNELKKDKTLWNLENPKSNLNYNSDILDCLAQNIIDERINGIFNSLKTTNSLSPKLFGEAVKDRAILMLSDRYLATYIALEFFYAKLYDIDLLIINFEGRAPNIDFNRKPTIQKQFPRDTIK